MPTRSCTASRDAVRRGGRRATRTRTRGTSGPVAARPASRSSPVARCRGERQRERWPVPDRTWRTGDRHRTEVVRIRADRWAPGFLDLLQQPPAAKRYDAGRMNEVRRQHVAREAGLVDDQHSMPLTSKEHRRRRPCAPGPYHDRVVHGDLLAVAFAALPTAIHPQPAAPSQELTGLSKRCKARHDPSSSPSGDLR